MYFVQYHVIFNFIPEQGLKALYVSLAFGLIIPLLLGIAVDLYIFMPLRYSKTTALVVHISEV